MVSQILAQWASEKEFVSGQRHKKWRLLLPEREKAERKRNATRRQGIYS